MGNRGNGYMQTLNGINTVTQYKEIWSELQRHPAKLSTKRTDSVNRECLCVCLCMSSFLPLFFLNVTSVLRSEVSLCERAWAGELDLSVSLSFCVVTTLLSVVASVVWTDTGRTSRIYVCVCMWIYTFHYRIKLYIQLVPRQWWHISWTLCTCNISE